jgi:dGTPase
VAALTAKQRSEAVASHVTRVALDQEKRDLRLHSKPTKQTPSDPRSSSRHDRDRVYYSAAFRRLAGVTQVLTPNPEGFLTHNRLTHSLKVGQVARSIAELLLTREDDYERIIALGGVDADVVETAALAHDLGHPPFGHIGEEILDKYAREELDLEDGFEGNAQTFRILTRLEARSPKKVGLDLTRASRSAVLKYPWFRITRRLNHDEEKEKDGIYRLQWKKFGVYKADEEAFLDAITFVPFQGAQSLEASVMDVADDITYALHDLEDFHSAGLLATAEARESLESWLNTYGYRDEIGLAAQDPYSNLATALSRDYPGHFEREAFVEAARVVANHLSSLLRESIVGHQRAVASVRTLVSKLITDYVGGISLNTETPTISSPPVLLRSDHWHQIQILKEITRHFIINRSDVAIFQHGQKKTLRELMELLRLWCRDDGERGRLPIELREDLDQWGDRAIIDFVANLSDHHAIGLYRALTGNGASLLTARFAF